MLPGVGAPASEFKSRKPVPDPLGGGVCLVLRSKVKVRFYNHKFSSLPLHSASFSLLQPSIGKKKIKIVHFAYRLMWKN